MAMSKSFLDGRVVLHEGDCRRKNASIKALGRLANAGPVFGGSE
jgi:hypothetical protein